MKAAEAFQERVYDLIEGQGYEFVRKERFFAARVLNQPIFSRRCEVGRDMFGKPRRPLFILYHPRLWKDNLVIQCKWQKTSGTTEEKLPFEVGTIAKGRIPTIIVLDGGGYTSSAKQWLLNQAGREHLEHVFDLKELVRFATQGRL